MPPQYLLAWNVDTNQRIHVKNADKFGNFRCCDDHCEGKMGVKRNYAKGGAKGPNNNEAHFFHICSNAGNSCAGSTNGETPEHHFSKHHVAENLQEYAFVKKECIDCHEMTFYDISGCKPQVERMVRGSKRIADVLLTRPDGKPHSIVEIFRTSAVIYQKRVEMADLNVHVIEVTTDNIEYATAHPKQNSPKFVVQTTDFEYARCIQCEDMRTLLQEWQKELTAVINTEFFWSNECIRHTYKIYGRLFQKIGINKAMNFEASVRHQKTKYRDDRNMISGKCKLCDSWIFGDALPPARDISAGDYCELEWNAMYREERCATYSKYVVKYQQGRSKTKVCAKCTIECFGCKKWMSLPKACKHGACSSCHYMFGLGDYVSKEQSLFEHEENEKLRKMNAAIAVERKAREDADKIQAKKDFIQAEKDFIQAEKNRAEAAARLREQQVADAKKWRVEQKIIDKAREEFLVKNKVEIDRVTKLEEERIATRMAEDQLLLERKNVRVQLDQARRTQHNDCEDRRKTMLSHFRSMFDKKS
jgi:hypothetical protein